MYLDERERVRLSLNQHWAFFVNSFTRRGIIQLPSNGFWIEEKQKQIFYGNEQNKIPIFHSSDYLKDFLCLKSKWDPILSNLIGWKIQLPIRGGRVKRNESTKYDYLGLGGGQVVSSLSTIRVRIPLTSTVFCVWKERKYTKRGRDGPIKNNQNMIFRFILLT